MTSVEQRRLTETLESWRRQASDLAEQAPGTMAEDCSTDGLPWEDLPRDDARSRAYPLNEDGICEIWHDRQPRCRPDAEPIEVHPDTARSSVVLGEP
jgi:hypothetical protein